MMDEEELTQIAFKDATWLQIHGLDQYNCLDYFSLSQFYDNSCLNEQVKMQSKFNALQQDQLDRRQMKGIEYDLWYFTQTPSLYVIKKQYRHSPANVDTLAVYYIVEGTIYQAPNMCKLLSNRLLTSLFHLNQSLSVIKNQADYSPFYPNQHFLWKEQEDAFKESKNKDPMVHAPSVHAQEAMLKFRQRMSELISDISKLKT